MPNDNPSENSSHKICIDATRTGTFKTDSAGVFFEFDTVAVKERLDSGRLWDTAYPVSYGRINEANVLLAFAALVYREVEGKKVKIRMIVEEE